MNRFPGLDAHDEQTIQAADLLVQAADTIAALVPGETLAGRSARLRGAACYAETAAHSLRETVGYLEAASAAEGSSVLDGEERKHD